MDFNKPETLKLSGNVSENFVNFKEEVLVYFEATETTKKPKNVQVARLKNLIGPEALRVYNTLTKDENETVESILKALEEYCIPKRNEIVEIYKFFNRKQKEYEPFDTFYTDLRALVRNCKFENQTDKLLRAQIVLGIYSIQTQKQLLKEDLTLEKTVNLCKTEEISKENLNTVRETQPKEIDAIHRSKFNKEDYRQKPTNKEVDYNQNDTNKFEEFTSTCKRCGRKHAFGKCPAMGKSCTKCGKPNHFSVACRTKISNPSNSSNTVHDISDNNNQEPTYCIDTLYKPAVCVIKDQRAWYKTIKVEGKFIKFKLDTGAEVNVVPYSILKQYDLENRITKTNTVTLEAFGGFKIKPIGYIETEVESNSKIGVVKFLVVKDVCNPILGLNACLDLNLIQRVDNIGASSKFEASKERVFNCNKSVFEGLGCFPDMCKIKIDKDAIPHSSSARRIPFKVRDRFEQTLKSLESRGIIKPVSEPVEWVSNLVIVEKPNGSLRLCIDPTYLNKYIIRERYTIPTIEEMSLNLANKKFFSVLDVKDGFYHLLLDEESSKLCSFSTIFGTYRFLRAPFGLSCLPELFQKLMIKYFGDIKGVSVYFDDLCIATETKEENDKVIEQVMNRAKKFNIRFNFDKFQYCKDKVKYLGMIFSEEGMLPDQTKVEAIKNIEDPQNKVELQRFLGMVNYLRSFIPNLSQIESPLREL